MGVDKHRVDGADRLQVGGGLVGDVELAKEIDEAALGAGCARAWCGLVGEVDLANKVSEASRCAGKLCATQCVGANAIGHAGLAALAGEEVGSRPEQISGRWCT